MKLRGRNAQDQSIKGFTKVPLVPRSEGKDDSQFQCLAAEEALEKSECDLSKHSGIHHKVSTTSSIQGPIAVQNLSFSSRSHIILSSETNQSSPKIRRKFQKSKPAMTHQISSKRWTYQDDMSLRKLILAQHEFNWSVLAERLNTTRAEVIRRWQESIYSTIKVSNKIAGALKWSSQEDSILIQSQLRLGFDWEKILMFLPSRSAFSIEGRWRRLSKDPAGYFLEEHSTGKDEEVNTSYMNKFMYRKHILKIIGAKRDCPWLQQGGKLATINTQHPKNI